MTTGKINRLPGILLFLLPVACFAQDTSVIFMSEGVKVTIDAPHHMKHKKSMLIFYALPNGNTTAQTFGKSTKEEKEWRYQIQHIGAQSQFLRKTLKSNVVVVYLENSLLSWPQWRKLRADNPQRIKHIIDSIAEMFGKKVSIHLNGHSGGGSLIFGFLQSVNDIPSRVKRITFLDSNYAYDSSYAPKFLRWLNAHRKNHLDVFAYNDSVALLDGKPFVSPTGGTWYRSHRMMDDLLHDYNESVSSNGIHVVTNKEGNIHFYLKPNPDRKIYHTQQVELNGFIHSVLCGTKHHEKGYKYYGERAYGIYVL